MIEPEEMLDPYDRALAQMPIATRRAWGTRVVAELVKRYGDRDQLTFEVHAGSPYRTSIEGGIIEAGWRLDVPLEGMPLGRQLAWYREARNNRPRKEAPVHPGGADRPR